MSWLNCFQTRFFVINVCFIFNIKIEKSNIWFENWFKSNRFSQCVTYVWKRFIMNIKSIVLIEFFAFQIIIFCDKQNCICVVLKNSINWLIATCCVKRIDFNHNEWCELKSFNKTYFASSFKKRFIDFNDEKSLFEKYEIDHAL